MDIHNWLLISINSIMNIHIIEIMDIHNCIMGKYGWAIMDILDCIMGNYD